MAQTRSDIPRPADPRAAAPRKGDAAREVAAVDADAGAGAEPLDLTEQIEALIGEIEEASQAADPWGEAAQRAAERNAESEERTLEPSQKLLAKVRDAAAAGVASGDAMVTDAGAVAVPVETSDVVASGVPSAETAEPVASASAIEPEAVILSASEPAVGAEDALADALDAELNEASAVAAAPITGSEHPAQSPDAQASIVEELVPKPAAESPAMVAVVAPSVDQAVAGEGDAVEAASTLAAELDAALQEAGDALERIVPPEDPPADVDAGASVAAAQVQVVDTAPEPAAVAAKEESAKAHWSTAPAPEAAVAEVAQVEVAAAPVAVASAEGLDAEDLDAALAAQAEELEEASRVAAAQPPASAPAESMPAPATIEEATTPAPAEVAVPEAASAVAHATQPAAAPAAASATPADAAAKPASHKTITTSVPVAAPAVEPAKARPVPAWRKVLAGLAKPVRMTGDILASPLALLPVNVRDIVAYLAAVTIFNASAVWAYMIFIHKPTVPPAAHDTPELHSTEPPPDAHGEKTDGHVAASHGVDAGHGKAAHGPASSSADHGGESHAAPAPSHGEAATPPGPAYAAEAEHAEAGHGEDAHAEASHEPAHEPAPH